MIDVKVSTLFNFTVTVDGQPFGFGMVADTREQACKNLIAKLTAVIGELSGELNRKASGSPS